MQLTIIYALVNSREDEKCFVTCALYEIELRECREKRNLGATPSYRALEITLRTQNQGTIQRTKIS